MTFASHIAVLFGQGPPNIQVVLPVFITVFSFLIIFMVFIARIVKCGPNEVVIVSGGFGKRIVENSLGSSTRQGYRIVQAGATFFFPFIQMVERLSLEIHDLDLKMPAVQLRDDLHVDIDCHAQIKVKNDKISISSAAEAFLSMNVDEVRAMVSKTFEGHIRTNFGSLTYKEIGEKRLGIGSTIGESTLEDLNKIGMTIVSFSVHSIHKSTGSERAQWSPIDGKSFNE